MDFSMPGTRNAAEAESVFSSICTIVRESTGACPTERKVRSIEFQEEGYRFAATVGSQFEYETVCCIVETKDEYRIFTPNRGLRRGEPTLIPARSVLKVDEY